MWPCEHSHKTHEDVGEEELGGGRWKGEGGPVLYFLRPMKYYFPTSQHYFPTSQYYFPTSHIKMERHFEFKRAINRKPGGHSNQKCSLQNHNCLDKSGRKQTDWSHALLPVLTPNLPSPPRRLIFPLSSHPFVPLPPLCLCSSGSCSSACIPSFCLS